MTDRNVQVTIGDFVALEASIRADERRRIVAWLRAMALDWQGLPMRASGIIDAADIIAREGAVKEPRE